MRSRIGNGQRPVIPEADARRIMLGGMRLDEHLKAMGILWPFTVARLLDEQDWAPFLAN